MTAKSEGRAGFVRSLVYNFFVHSFRLSLAVGLQRAWGWSWKQSCRAFSGGVSSVIHDRRVTVNYGYTYPLVARQFPDFNAPLLELTYQTWKARGRQICFVDVGAAVGDTVLLLYSNLSEALAGFVCIDGDPEFFRYLQCNLRHLPNGRLVSCALSSSNDDIADLVRTHRGTASALGSQSISATTLSQVVSESVDLVKIDVDGSDGRVLLGAHELLRRDRPTVIFEWHPALCRNAGNSWEDHFTALRGAGYSRFVWFTKFGKFSHFMFSEDTRGVDELAEYCLSVPSEDRHYDVVAIPDGSLVDLQALAALEFARNRKSRF